MASVELIGKIYDAAMEPTLWPELLENVLQELDANSSVQATQQIHTLNSNAKTSLISQSSAVQVNNDWASAIKAHLNRATSISTELAKATEQQSATNTLLEQINVPVLIVTGDFEFISSNNLGKTLLKEGDFASLHNNHIRLTNFKAHRQLSSATANFHQSATNNLLSIRLNQANHTEAGTVTLLQLCEETSQYMLLFALAESTLNLDATRLKQVYGLSKAESALIELLIKGHSLLEMTELRHVSINTLRTQLKSCFAKTGTTRQAELVKLALTSPYLLAHDDGNKLTAKQGIDYQAKELNQQILLSDGRKLGYAEFGDLKGEPVFVFHPVTGSRLQGHPNNQIAKKLKARIIIPDRPGFGLSSPLANRTLLDWPKDVCELADALRLEKFSIIGFCGGAPFAHACANKIPERLKNVSIVSGVTPYDNINLLHGVSTANKSLLNLAVKLPDTLFSFVSLMMRSLVKRPERYLDHVLEELCKTDQQALAEPELIDNFIAALGQAFKQGPQAFTDEQVMYSTKWPFEAEQTQIPITLWHGDEDKHVDITLAKRLSSALPNANINVMEGYGHFLIYHRWRDILHDCLNCARK